MLKSRIKINRITTSIPRNSPKENSLWGKVWNKKCQNDNSGLSLHGGTMSYFAHLFPLYAYFNMEKDVLKYIFNKLYLFILLILTI